MKLIVYIKNFFFFQIEMIIRYHRILNSWEKKSDSIREEEKNVAREMPFILFDFVRFGPPLPKRLRGPVFSNLATLQLSSAPSPLHRVFQLTRRALFSRSSTFLGRAAYILHATFFSRKTGTFFFFQDLNRETRVKIAVFNCDERVAESPGKINTALD